MDSKQNQVSQPVTDKFGSVWSLFSRETKTYWYDTDYWVVESKYQKMPDYLLGIVCAPNQHHHWWLSKQLGRSSSIDCKNSASYNGGNNGYHVDKWQQYVLDLISQRKNVKILNTAIASSSIWYLDHLQFSWVLRPVRPDNGLLTLAGDKITDYHHRWLKTMGIVDILKFISSFKWSD